MGNRLRYLILAGLLSLEACTEQQARDRPVQKDSVPAASLTTGNQSDTAVVAVAEPAEDLVPYYVVMLDSGQDYYRLDRQMLDLHRATGLVIDTMDRSYDASRDLIALPPDDEDVMYAGAYYPRRSEGCWLSIEYMQVFHEGASGKMMVLVAGIFPQEQQADSLAKVLRQAAPAVFYKRSLIYMGCMH